MDPYELCPCGSGKKVKFCCQKLLPEMEKIERLQENQPEQALIHLDRLEKSSPGNPWVATMRAGTLMQQGEFGEAKISILKFLKEHPDHPRANALYAFASFHADGYPACKKAVHRAFKRCVTESPRIVSALLEALGEHHYMGGNLLAARAHLMLALRIAVLDEDRDRVIRSIMRFDSDPAIPFLLRGGQHIPTYEPPAGAKEAFDKARHLSLLACWEEAADLLEGITEQDGDAAALWHMLGLFRAWDGDEESAAEALHKAARLYRDGPVAVECEVLAQFLDRAHSDRVIPMRMQRYEVTSVSQMLSRLDEHPRFVRADDERPAQRERGEPVATYLILDRELPSREALADLTVESVPLYLGRVLAFDAVPDDDLKPTAFLTGLEGEQLSAAEAAFLAAAQGLATRMEKLTPELVNAESSPPEADAELDVIGEIHLDELPLHRNYFLPPGTPGPVRTEILDHHWRRIVSDLWPSSPQEVLHGKSPVEAAQDPSLRVPLEAALQLLQAFGDERQRLLPVDELRQRLTLSPLPAAAIEGAGQAGGLSNFDLERLPLGEMTAEQLLELIERLSLSGHPRLLYAALQQWMRLDDQAPSQKPETVAIRERLLDRLISLAAMFAQPAAALDWVRRGLQLAESATEHKFERQLEWKLRELRTRAVFERPEDLRLLLIELWENYGRKLPNLRTQLSQFVSQLGIDPPWESAIVTAGSAWSPTAVASTGDASKKLWVPGQD